MTMENETTQARACPKDCRRCSFQQHTYCAAQMAYATLTLVQDMAARLEAVEKTVGDIVVATDELIDPVAQEGSGAEQ